MFSFVACVGLLPQGIPEGHDLTYEIVRVAEYVNTLKDGGLPARWSANLAGGYGEPIFNFFPPVFLSVAGVLVFFGTSIITAIKIAILIFTVVGGVGMYLFASKFYGRAGSLLSGCLYIFAPYHMIDVYIRNAYAEYAACSLAPYVFWAIARICHENNAIKINNALLLPLAISGCLFALSHNLSLMMYIPLFALFYLVGFALTKDWRSLSTLWAGILLAFCLSAFYILPILFEKEYIQLWQLTVGRFDVFQNFTTLTSLFWGGGCSSISPFSLILMLLATAAIIIKWRNMSRIVQTTLCLFWVFLLGLLFLMTPASVFIWKRLPFMHIIQFPWRLLSPATFVLCFLAGSITFLLSEKFVIQRLMPTILLLFSVSALVIFNHAAKSAEYLVVDDTELAPSRISRLNLRATVLTEYRPRWASSQLKLSYPGLGLTVFDQSAQVQEIASEGIKQEYQLSLPRPSKVMANIHYFPGWTILDNGHVLTFKVTPQGLMTFDLSPGDHNVQLVFCNTPVRAVGNFISILGVLGLLGLSLLRVNAGKARGME